MSTVQLVHIFLALSLLMALLLEVGSLPAVSSVPSPSDRHGRHPSTGPVGIEANAADNVREPTFAIHGGHQESGHDQKRPDSTSDGEPAEHMLEWAHRLQAIEARIEELYRAGLEDHSDDEHSPLGHEDYEQSADGPITEERSKRSIKGRRRAMYDFMVI